MKKVFINPDSIQNNIVTICGDEFYHLVRVLRTTVGDKFIALVGNDYEYSCTVTGITKSALTAEVDSKTFCTANPKIIIDVFQGLPKGDKLELIIQKITELGASALIPFESNFTVAKNNSVKLERVKKIAREACKQCGRSKPLEIKPTIKLAAINRELDKYDLVLFLYEHAPTINKLSHIYNKIISAQRIAIIVGSEGGFSEAENDFLSHLNTEKISLGKRILRTETAAISLVAYLSFLTGN